MTEPGTAMTIGDAFAFAQSELRQGRIAEAERIFRQIVDLQPAHADASHGLAICLSQRGDFQAALPHYDAALKANPAHVGCLNNLGNALQGLRRFDAALDCYERAITLDPSNSTFHTNRGNCLKELGRPEDALASYTRALSMKADHVAAYFNRGVVLHELGRFTDALADFGKAISLRPQYAGAYGSRGATLHELKRYDEALVDFDRAVQLDPHDAHAWSNRGNVLQRLHRVADAVASCDQAIALHGSLAEAHCNRGSALNQMQRHDAALASLDRAIALKPDLAEAHVNRGSALFRLGRYGEALASRERVIALNPDLPYAVGDWLYAKMSCCSWTGFDAACQRVLAGIDRGDRIATPYVSLLIHSTPEQQQRCARSYATDQYPARATSAPFREHDRRDRIRIGYLSAAFRNAPAAHLMAHLFECHDRSAFEIVALDVGPPADDPWRRRLRRAFDSVHDVASRSDREIAALIGELGIDILIHRDGHNDLSRTGIFALRPAPVQVNYLGYPGTLGAPYIDYIIADPMLIPRRSRHHFDEKIVELPHSYQPNDPTRVISDRAISRAEFGLPDDAFVFCCFNNNTKITPDVFDAWMRLLRAVGNGVLWLLECSPVAAEHLCREAEARGVSPQRLVFAPRVEVSEHLARHRCADLFLDTFYYGAHTTASDALWAGLPVLTCPGEAMAARVAASLLSAVGLPELIASDRGDYEAKALALALDPGRLAAIRRALAENRPTRPLFDTARYTRYLEQAYLQMHARRLAGRSPDHIVIAA